ncbi:hypothetical protein LINGRAHAP2_LOCUS7780, partial [Linum grandiflorum]
SKLPLLSSYLHFLLLLLLSSSLKFSDSSSGGGCHQQSPIIFVPSVHQCRWRLAGPRHLLFRDRRSSAASSSSRCSPFLISRSPVDTGDF